MQPMYTAPMTHNTVHLTLSNSVEAPIKLALGTHALPTVHSTKSKKIKTSIGTVTNSYRTNGRLSFPARKL
jgi:hypothetical protein